jgi:hypothetical protein
MGKIKKFHVMHISDMIYKSHHSIGLSMIIAAIKMRTSVQRELCMVLLCSSQVNFFKKGFKRGRNDFIDIQ